MKTTPLNRNDGEVIGIQARASNANLSSFQHEYVRDHSAKQPSIAVTRSREARWRATRDDNTIEPAALNASSRTNQSKLGTVNKEVTASDTLLLYEDTWICTVVSTGMKKPGSVRRNRMLSHFQSKSTTSSDR